MLPRREPTATVSETGQDAAAPAAPAPQAGQAPPETGRSRTPDTGWRPPSRPEDGRSANGSPNPPPPPADGRAESGAEGPAERASPASDFLHRLFGRKGVRSDGAAGAPEGPRSEPASRPDADGREPSPQRPDAPPLSERAGAISQQLAALSGDELQELAQADGPFSRAVQSEIDRRVARANKQRDEQGRFTRQQRVEGLKQQARELRQTDVYKAAELEEQVDALQQQEGFVRGLVEHYDRVSLDPIMAALPEADRAPLLAAVPEGLEGRLQLVRAALSRLEQVWRADEARKLRGGPQRKRDNAQRRAQRAEDDGEPELVAGIGRGRNGVPSMNDWLRGELTRR
jgi:hypothetical protein